MIKRMMLLAGMALAAVAFTAPVAQADVFLSDETGPVEAGAEITATSSNLVFTRDGSFLSCTTVGLDLKVEDAGPEHLELKQTKPVTTIGCELNREESELSNLALTIDDGTIGVGEGNIMTIDTWGTGETNTTFNLTIFGGPFTHESHTGILVAACHFEGPTHVEPTGETSDTLQMTGEVDGPCGEAHVHGEFTLKTHDGHPVQIHYNETS